MSKTPSISIGRLIFIPAVITLAVTILRLVGELQHWSHTLFNPNAGGPGALIGISWLPFVFGIYFALKLMQAGDGPASAPRALLHVIIGIVVIVAGLVITPRLHPSFYVQLLAACLLLPVAAAIQYPAWPGLFKTLLAYAFAARIPVAILMYFAMRGNWGTHYDAVSPQAPEAVKTDLGSKYFWLALLPQLLLWVGFTVVTGALTGSITALLKRRKPVEQAVTA
jgi:hypothetical protein